MTSTDAKTDAEELVLLGDALRASKSGRAPDGTNPLDWARSEGLVRSSIGLADPTVVGLMPAGVIAAGRLARSIRANSPDYRLGTTATAFANQVIVILLEALSARGTHQPTAAGLTDLKAKASCKNN